jgi:tellurite resistance protein
VLFLHEFERIEAEAFLTLAAEMIEEDGIITAEEDALLDEYAKALGVYGFTYDAAAAAAARDTLAQLNDVSKRKAYMELYSFAICDGVEDPAERRALNELREALGIDEHIAGKLEACAQDLFDVYDEIEDALGADPSPIKVEN